MRMPVQLVMYPMTPVNNGMVISCSKRRFMAVPLVVSTSEAARSRLGELVDCHYRLIYL